MIVLFTCLSACTRKQLQLSPVDYIAFFEKPDNGFAKKISTTDITYLIQTKTPEYIALKENNSQHIDNEVVKARIRSLDSSVWFAIKIMSAKGDVNPLKNNTTSLDEYNMKLNYFLSDAQNFFTLEYGNKQQAQIAYYFENSYGVTPYETIVIGFKLSDNLYNKEINLRYDDHLLNTGIIKMSISGDDLSNKPQLIL